jgi:hypothetical protein
MGEDFYPTGTMSSLALVEMTNQAGSLQSERCGLESLCEGFESLCEGLQTSAVSIKKVPVIWQMTGTFSCWLRRIAKSSGLAQDWAILGQPGGLGIRIET